MGFGIVVLVVSSLQDFIGLLALGDLRVYDICGSGSLLCAVDQRSTHFSMSAGTPFEEYYVMLSFRLHQIS